MEERRKKFIDIINEYKSQRDSAKEKANNFASDLTKLDKKKLKRVQKEVGQKLEDLKKRVESYEIMLKRFLELLKDEWAPAPITTIKKEEEKVEKINQDVKENFFVIKIGKTTISNTSANLRMILSND